MADLFGKKPNPSISLGSVYGLGQKPTLASLARGVKSVPQPTVSDLSRALGHRPTLASLASGVTPQSKTSLSDLVHGLAPSLPPAPSRPQPDYVSGLLGLAAPSSSGIFGSLAPSPPARPVQPYAAPAPVKRKAYFAFHFEDVMRVNVVRKAWKIAHPENALMRSFYDSSLWESRKLEGDDALKRLIREGVRYTSAVCVLAGSETWLRRWVRYEIARAIIDERGLLTVHLNSIRHHQMKTPHTRGPNPLDFIAIGKVQGFGESRYYLFEKLAKRDAFGAHKWEWHRYADYTDPVKRPLWVTDPGPGFVTPLSANAGLYDYIAEEGHKNIGAWIDRAAVRAGR